VLTAGVEALAEKQRRQQRHDAKISAINAALEEGERSGIAEDYSLEATLAKLGACWRSPLGVPRFRLTKSAQADVSNRALEPLAL
jgi:hypothetical protein